MNNSKINILRWNKVSKKTSFLLEKKLNLYIKQKNKKKGLNFPKLFLLLCLFRNTNQAQPNL